MTPTRWACSIPLVSSHNFSPRPEAVAVAFYFSCLSIVTTSRPGGLRPPTSTIVPADGRFPRLLQRHLTCVLREREGEVVP